MSSEERSIGSIANGFVPTLVISTFLMGSSFVAGKILLSQGFEPMILVGWRFFVAAMATLPFVILSPEPKGRRLVPAGTTFRDAGWVFLIGLLQTAAVMGLLFLAMRSISASTAAILLFTNPIWVAVLGRVFLREALSALRIVGLLLGIAGVALAIGLGGAASGGAALLGEVIGLASAFCWAAATIVNKRVALPFQTWALSFWQMLIGSIVLLAIGYGIGESWPSDPTPEQWGWFLWLAVPASTGSFGLWFVALGKGGATRASSYLFLAPLFTVAISFFVLHTTLAWPQVAGGVLIALALWLINRTPCRIGDQERRKEALAEGEP